MSGSISARRIGSFDNVLISVVTGFFDDKRPLSVNQGCEQISRIDARFFGSTCNIRPIRSLTEGSK